MVFASGLMFLILHSAYSLSQATHVVKGTDADISQYPFQVSLRYNDKHLCGGTILNANWVLTAAHCFDMSTANMYSVQVGETEISEDYGTIIDVHTIIRHPKYNASNGFINDIAVIKLKSPLPLGRLIKPVTLASPNQEISAGTTGTVIGWGAQSANGEGSTVLQKVNILVVLEKECAKVYPKLIHATNICAGVPQGGKGQCTGDSGGPLLVRNQQVGIVSWSMKPCAKKGYPGVFTKVSHYRNWIKNNIN